MKTVALLVAFAACSPSDRDEPPTGTIEVQPADLDVTIVDGTVIAQAYTATRVGEDGERIDITDRVMFALESSGFGSWTGPTLNITGAAVGQTHVLAIDGGASGSTNLTVRVINTRFDGPVPANIRQQFDDATPTLGHAPTVVYPAPGILLPPNLGELDVHWRDWAANSIYEIKLATEYIDLRIYKQSVNEGFVTYRWQDWFQIASSRSPITVTVSGIDPAHPAEKGVSTALPIDVTNETVQGGMYYWTTQPQTGVYRYDMGAPDTPPAPFFQPSQQPTPCIGCHSLSKDGSRMAITLDSGNGRGTIIDVATGTSLLDYQSNAQYWNFATFTPAADKLVTVYAGNMVLRSAQDGSVIAPIPNSLGLTATHPDLSPDGSQLANVETASPIWDFQVTGGSIVTRSYDAATDTFGPIQVLVADAPGAANFYPSWSPDGQWLLFTRTTGNSYAEATAEIWVVKADGSQPPIKLMNADAGIMSSWARWAPFQQTVGDTPIYYLTFSSMRPFGIRPTTGQQIWMTPFFPDRAAAGEDPSGPAFRMPFQRLETSNHIAQWTQAVVIGKPSH